MKIHLCKSYCHIASKVCLYLKFNFHTIVFDPTDTLILARLGKYYNTTAYCAGIVQEAMDKYWKDKSKDGKVAGDWHFYKKSVLEKLSSLENNSVVLTRMMKQKSNLPFMNF